MALQQVEQHTRRIPLEKRKRSSMSCDFCSDRRCKCIRPDPKEPCLKCRQYDVACSFSKPRKTRVYGSVEGLDARFRIMESILGGIFPEMPLKQTSDLISLGSGLGLQMPDASFDKGKLTVAHKQQSNPMEPEVRRSRRIAITRTSTFNGQEKWLHDSMGKERYIGPTGSFFLINTLRQIISQRNSQSDFVQDELAITFEDCIRLSDFTENSKLPTRNIADTLVDAFFVNYHRDYPLFHKDTFLGDYEAMYSPHPITDPSWLCCLYMVLVLGDPEKDTEYFQKAQAIVPQVVCTPKLGSVQALMLLSFYFHNANERNACWTFIGAAIRLAYAVGLHREGTDLRFTPLQKQIRKRVWWTLYSFERFLCSSLGRPSAIDDTDCDAEVPAGHLLDSEMAPLGYVRHNSLLARILGKIIKLVDSVSKGTNEEVYKEVLGRLNQWEADLPPQLLLMRETPPFYQRAVHLLHIRHQYAISLLTWPSLLQGRSLELSDACIQAAQQSSRLLQSLFDVGQYSCGIEVFFAYSSVMVLALGCLSGMNLIKEIKSSVALLDHLHLWGTMARFADVMRDLEKAVGPSVYAAQALHATSEPQPHLSRWDANNLSSSLQPNVTPHQYVPTSPGVSTWEDLSTMLLSNDPDNYAQNFNYFADNQQGGFMYHS